MASYDLNEVLKKRAERTAADHMKDRMDSGQAGGYQGNSFARAAEKAVDLGDVSRVKVLSPGRQVFKRFIRNRLAVLGTVILLVMFFFSFVCVLFYPYGQKQIFYTYETQNVNYALAKANTAFNGYEVDSSIPVERNIVNSMNSNIKQMIAAGEEQKLVMGAEGEYLIRRTADNIYTISSVPMEEVASFGNGSVLVGTYSMVGKSMEFTGKEIEGVAEEAAKSAKGTEGSFTVDGIVYTYTKGSKPKTFDVFTEQGGFLYKGESLGEEFEAEVLSAVDSGKEFSYDGISYVLTEKNGNYTIYSMGEPSVARIYTSYTLDTYETGLKVADDFRSKALMAVTDQGQFESGYKGKESASFTIKEGDNILLVYDEEGNEFAEFSLFAIRRYSGEDTMAYDLKKTLSAKVEEMLLAAEKTGTVMAMIPQQDENGAYIENEDGTYVLNEVEMRITQRLEGEYVINADQINFVIDRFASPSAKHLLGTDGDGFDVLARVMYGGQVSLMVGFVVVILESAIGIVMGGLAGYFGGWVDNLIMRMVDVFYCLPSLPIMIILGAIMDAARVEPMKRLWVMMAVLGLLGWAGVARLVRGQILSLREQEFMVATEATGIRVKSRIFKHLIPNVMPQLIVTATMGLGSVIITESTLSFLGLGVKHPLATWGTIINSVSSASAMAHYAFIWIPVGLLICLTVIAFNFVGDGLRDAYDPKSKR